MHEEKKAARRNDYARWDKIADEDSDEEFDMENFPKYDTRPLWQQKSQQSSSSEKTDAKAGAALVPKEADDGFFERLDAQLPMHLQSRLDSLLHASLLDVLDGSEKAGLIPAEDAAVWRACAETSTVRGETIFAIGSLLGETAETMSWLLALHEEQTEAIQKQQPLFEQAMQGLGDDDGRPGRVTLELPSRDSLEVMLVRSVMIFRLFTDTDRMHNESTVYGSDEQYHPSEKYRKWVLRSWQNRKLALTHLARWLEVEGSHSDAESLHAILADCARLAYKAKNIQPLSTIDTKLGLATSLDDYALCVKRQGFYGVALPLYREAVGIYPHGEAPRSLRDRLSECIAVINQPAGPAADGEGEDDGEGGGEGGGNGGGEGDRQGDAQKAGATDAQANAETRERAKTLGNESFKSKRFEEAFTLYTAALDIDDCATRCERATPEARATLLSNRAAASLGQDDYYSAAHDAAEAVQLDPENSKAWYRLGLSLRFTCSAKDALEPLAVALELKPDDKAVVKLIAEVQAAVEEEEEKERKARLPNVSFAATGDNEEEPNEMSFTPNTVFHGTPRLTRGFLSG